MALEFNTQPIDYTDRAIFEIWHDRFVNEYNRSQQARQGCILKLGTPRAHWDQSFENNVGPLWIKHGKRNIGFISPQAVTIGIDNESAQQIQIISDVYIDPKFRGRGLLAACLLEQREHHREAILIDRKKLIDNASYYAALGFKYGMHWLDQELLIISPKKLIHDDLWISYLPDEVCQLGFSPLPGGLFYYSTCSLLFLFSG